MFVGSVLLISLAFSAILNHCSLFTPPTPSRSCTLAPCPAGVFFPPCWLGPALSVSHCSLWILGLQSCPPPSSELFPGTPCLLPARDSRPGSQTPGEALPTVGTVSGRYFYPWCGCLWPAGPAPSVPFWPLSCIGLMASVNPPMSTSSSVMKHWRNPHFCDYSTVSMFL